MSPLSPLRLKVGGSCPPGPMVAPPMALSPYRRPDPGRRYRAVCYLFWLAATGWCVAVWPDWNASQTRSSQFCRRSAAVGATRTTWRLQRHSWSGGLAQTRRRRVSCCRRAVCRLCTCENRRCASGTRPWGRQCSRWNPRVQTRTATASDRCPCWSHDAVSLDVMSPTHDSILMSLCRPWRDYLVTRLSVIAKKRAVCFFFRTTSVSRPTE